MDLRQLIRGEATTVIVILMVVVSRWLFLLLVILSFLRLKSMIEKQAKWTAEDLERLGLM
jgi:hypothetical protein